ncbi:sulfurtransferase-like selenium metabolism protein YedF [Geobacter sp. SVR]|uniref:sulfurtransferase-like selenium metabolism protein YedF n=1 Tax=Geobacter sp. SVR TaxID=2495594 RepID=UPI00143EF4E9|nr:sulfurtransferase-like selenium metabolism protein YedF [Geobacter sp. SVR]BCS53171.1 selenium metabolism protein YedF [Geobacter sp. SVR]GCF84556.1 selenium metabolism protein YedF [Geobacter sp. SVR]
MNVIDCRGMSCPAPVIAVKRALEEQPELQVLLDDGAPFENVTRFARNRGFKVSERRLEDGWAVDLTAGDSAVPQGEKAGMQEDLVLLITSDRLGDGPEDLGRLLMKNFIHTLLETRSCPTRIFFMNTGVLLSTEGSDVFEALEKLRGMGVEVLSCGLCLDYFGLKEKPRVGETTNMLTTAENLLTAGRVVKL